MTTIKIDEINQKIEIDNTEYVLKENVEKLAIEKMKEILSVTCGYRDDIIENIIKYHFKEESKDKKVGKSKPKQKHDVFQPNSIHRKPFVIQRVDRMGNVFRSKGKNSWNMDQVLFIKKNYSKDMTYEDVHKLADKVKLSNHIVGRIIWNLEQGNLDSVITTYENLIYTKPKIEIQNNPEKRKEMGYYG